MGSFDIKDIYQAMNLCITLSCFILFSIVLTDDLYEILSSLPESVVYSCQPCTRAQTGGVQGREEGGGWRELLLLELRAGVEKVLACLLSSTLTQHLVTCSEVWLTLHF